MEFRTIEVFYAVATLRSFARAAESLHMTQSAVSQRIANLEAEIGARLLERTAKGASLTPKGHIMLVYAERMLTMRTELIQTLADPQISNRLIRLGVADTVAHTWLPTFIGRVNTEYPFITFEIEVDVTSNLRTRLLRQEIDLAFLLGRVMEPGITSIDLCSYPLSFVASTRLRFKERPVRAETISHYPLISFPRTTVLHKALEDVFRERGLRIPRIHSSSSISTIVKMTLDNIGISVISPQAIRPELGEGRLAIVPVDVQLPTLDYTATYGATPGTQLVAALARMAGDVAKQWASRD